MSSPPELREVDASQACQVLTLVGAHSFRGMKHTLSGRQEKTLYKMIVDPKTDKVLGIHIVGDGAGEVIQLAVGLSPLHA